MENKYKKHKNLFYPNVGDLVFITTTGADKRTIQLYRHVFEHKLQKSNVSTNNVVWSYKVLDGVHIQELMKDKNRCLNIDLVTGPKSVIIAPLLKKTVGICVGSLNARNVNISIHYNKCYVVLFASHLYVVFPYFGNVFKKLR